MFVFIVVVLQRYKPGDIHKAACKGDIKQLEQCLKNGADVNELEHVHERTPLILAVQHVHKDCVVFLISRKANVNYIDKHNEVFALAACASAGNREICEILLKAGADKTLTNEGKTASQYASDHGYKDVALFIDLWPAIQTTQTTTTSEVKS